MSTDVRNSLVPVSKKRYELIVVFYNEFSVFVKVVNTSEKGNESSYVP
jgi:hypothetical protein